MKKITALLIIAFFFHATIVAQNNKLDKKMEKAYNLVEKNKIEDAEKYMVKLLDENPNYGDGWDYLAKIRYKQYRDSKAIDNLFGGNIVVTTKDKDGKEVKAEDDSLGQKLMQMLNNTKPSLKAYDKFVYTLREATFKSQDAYYSSQSLRNLFIDEPKDTSISDNALKTFNEAEEEFGKKNYNEAAKLYKKAIEEQPDFYKAALYMGDCFYYLGNYIEAIKSFNAAIEKFPRELEPRKYLIDAYAKEGLYDKALDEIFKTQTVYPDQSISYAKMDDALYLNRKKTSITWIPRGCFPNNLKKYSEIEAINKYVPESKPKIKNPWLLYQKAGEEIGKYCNEKGIIISTNQLTTGKYSEIYAWEEMLKNSNDPSLNEAKKMQKDGYLDCYVLVTCYHFDIYSQYLDFATKNKAKIIEYYNKYIEPIK